MKEYFRHHYLLLFLLAFCLRIGWFIIIMIKNPSGFMLYDSWGYLRIAGNLTDYGIFSQGEKEWLMPDSSRTPIYPLFIYMLNKFFSGYYSIIIFQIILSSLICLLTAKFSEKIFQGKTAGIMAGIFLALDFPSVFFANTILTETLFTGLLLLSIYYFTEFTQSLQKPDFEQRGQRKFLVFSAAWLGIAILCRPVAVYLPIVFGVAILAAQKFLTQPCSEQCRTGTQRTPEKPIEKKENSMLSVYKTHKKSFFHKAIPALVFILISYAVVSPWIMRNQIVFGSPFLSSISDINLLSYTAAAIRAENEGKSIAEIQMENKAFSVTNFDWEKPEEIVRYMNYCRAETFKIISENPLMFLKNQLTSLMYFFIKPLRSYIDVQLGYSNGYNSIAETSGTKRLGNISAFALALVIFQILMLFIMACFIIINLLRARLKLTFIPLFIITIIACFAILSTFTEVDARMRVVVMPLICALAGVGLAGTVKR